MIPIVLGHHCTSFHVTFDQYQSFSSLVRLALQWNQHAIQNIDLFFIFFCLLVSHLQTSNSRIRRELQLVSGKECTHPSTGMLTAPY